SRWGIRWIGDLGEADLDPHLLFWDIRRTIDPARWPRARTVVAFELTDVAPATRHWWLVVAADGVAVCDFHPGYAVDAHVQTTLRALVEVWRGDRSWHAATDAGLVVISGTGPVRRAVPRWLGQAELASVPRPVGVVAGPAQDASRSRSRAPA